MDLIDGKYIIIKPLGSGLSGEVFLVRDPKRRLLALKFLKEWMPGVDPQTALASFKREFEILKSLSHPHIARIVDFGRHEEGGRQRTYFTAEWIDGRDFFSATEGKSPDGIEALFVCALRALEYLHSRGIIHLDLKTDNVLVTADGGLKIIDFGLSGRGGMPATGGTPATMAPEIIYRETPDGRADLYSLGVLCYQALARVNPFRGATVHETLENHKKLKAPPVSQFNPAVADYLDRILARLLEKKRTERYASAGQVIRDINLLSGKNYPVETADTRVGYLFGETSLVGRGEEIRRALEFCRTLGSLPAGTRKAFWIQGEKGSGKTRLLTELKYDCQLAGLRVHFADARAEPPTPDQPTVILFDDADCLTETGGRLWQNFFQRNRGLSLLTLASSAPGMRHLPLFWPFASSSGFEAILLRNLSPEETREHLRLATGLKDPPESLVSALFSRTAGHPLFVNELIKTLLTGGFFFDPEGRVHPFLLEGRSPDFSQLKIPETVGGLLKQVFTEETRTARQILALLSLLGHPMPLSELERLLAPAKIRGDFVRLVQTDRLIWEMRKNEVEIKNPLWTEVINDILPPGERRRWHDRIARWLEKRGGDPDEVSRHWGFGSNPEKAVKKLLPLAKDLLNRGRGREAGPILRTLLGRLASSDFKRKISALFDLGSACLQTGLYHESEKTFREIRPLLSRLRKRVEAVSLEMDIHEKLGVVALKMKKTDAALREIETALKLVAEHGEDVVRRMILENSRAQVFCQKGQFGEAEKIFLENRQIWDRWPEARQNRVVNNDLGFVYLLLGKPGQAMTVLEKELDFYRRLPKRYPEARCRYNLAEACLARGDYAEAREHYQTCLHLAQEFTGDDLCLRVYNGLGNLASDFETGTREEGIDCYLRALSLAHQRDEPSLQGAIHSNLGILYRKQSRLVEAEFHLRGAIRILSSLEAKTAYDASALARAFLGMAGLCRSRKKFGEAREFLNRVKNEMAQSPGAASLADWVAQEEVGLVTDEKGREKTREETMAATPPAPTSEAWKDLLRMVRWVGNERELDALLKTILHYALELSRAEMALILLPSADKSLEIRASVSAVVNDELATFSQQVARQVLEEGRALVTTNIREDPRFSDSQSVHLLKLRSVVVLPVTVPGKTIGVLYLDTRTPSAGIEAPAGEKLELLQAFADQAGLAIENAQSLREARKVQDHLRQKLSHVRAELGRITSSQRILTTETDGESRAETTEGRVLVDGINPYETRYRWKDYELIFLAHAFRHHGYRALPTAKAVGLSPPTLYRKIREGNLEDRANPLYAVDFTYSAGMTLREFCRKLFGAALAYHKKPYRALRVLGVSQGFFYKMTRG